MSTDTVLKTTAGRGTQLDIPVGGMSCASCVGRVERAVAAVRGRRSRRGQSRDRARPCHPGRRRMSIRGHRLRPSARPATSRRRSTVELARRGHDLRLLRRPGREGAEGGARRPRRARSISRPSAPPCACSAARTSPPICAARRRRRLSRPSRSQAGSRQTDRERAGARGRARRPARALIIAADRDRAAARLRDGRAPVRRRCTISWPAGSARATSSSSRSCWRASCSSARACASFRKGWPALLRGAPDMNSLVMLGTSAA